MSSPTTLPLLHKESTTTTYAKITGSWLWITKIIWVIGLAAALTLAVPATLKDFRLRQVPCDTEGCTGLSTADAEALRDIGISMPLYAGALASVAVLNLVVSIAIAAVLLWRKPDDWLVLDVSLLLIVTAGIVTGDVYKVSSAPPWLFLCDLFNILAEVLFVMFCLAFPDGRLVPRWGRWLLPIYLAVFIAQYVFVGGPFGGLTQAVSLLLIMTTLIAQVYRYRRVSTGVQRQQTKWVVFGLVSFVLGIIIILYGIMPILSRLHAHVGWSILSLMVIDLITLFLPLSIGISMMRYRLWDIDFIINRTLIYSALTAVLLVVFVGAFFVLRALTQAILGNNHALLGAVVSTIVCMALFNPVRRQIRGLVDKKLYGIQIEYQSPGAAPIPGGDTITSIGLYQNLQHIGTGGMAEVYRSQHPTSGVPVAVKVLPARLASEEQFRKRFEREARIVSQLKHPNIVRMEDFGIVDGTYFMALEYIQGTDLHRHLKERGALALNEAAQIAGQIASALDYAHGQGLVHRDIKPSNVMLDQSGRAVLMDFGITKILTGGTLLTSTGIIGTLAYMAPEQIQAHEIDGRADIYSLGIMLYEMLTSELPFKQQHPGALLIAHLNQVPPDPRSVKPAIPDSSARAILKALEKDPAKRFASARELADALC